MVHINHGRFEMKNMENKNLNGKNPKPSNNPNHARCRNMDSLGRNGQMIMLMGVTLAVSVFVISSIATEISDLDVVVSSSRSTSLVPEFLYLKEAFGTALNYDLVSISINPSTSESSFYGDIKSINASFDRTKNSFYVIEMKHDIFFEAVLNNYWWDSNLTDEGHIYNIDVTLSLDDGETCITQDVIYYIICKDYLPT